MHVGHGLGLVHDLGLGVAQAISLVGITLGGVGDIIGKRVAVPGLLGW